MKFNIFNNKNKRNETTYTEPVTDDTDHFTNDSDFKLVFNDTSVNETNCQVISFGDLTKSKLSDSLTIFRKEEPITRLKLFYTYSSSSILNAVKFNRFVAIGLSGFFYLYDLSEKSVILFIDFNGYFDEFKIFENHLLVAYNSGIYCLTKYGRIKWHNGSVGIDGINIKSIENGKIYGSEQIDPPDGWTEFILDFETGARVN